MHHQCAPAIGRLEVSRRQLNPRHSCRTTPSELRSTAWRIMWYSMATRERSIQQERIARTSQTSTTLYPPPHLTSRGKRAAVEAAGPKPKSNAWHTVFEQHQDRHRFSDASFPDSQSEKGAVLSSACLTHISREPIPRTHASKTLSHSPRRPLSSSQSSPHIHAPPLFVQLVGCNAGHTSPNFTCYIFGYGGAIVVGNCW